MNTPVVVTLGEACDTTVVRESETTVVQHVVETQLVVAPGCGGASGGGGGGGVSSYNDLTDVPTEFPSSAHMHAISDVIGLAPNAYPFTQSSPSDTWTINHSLGFYPNVETRSVGGKEMLGEVLHTSTNQVIIYFDSAFAGTATCS